ncbi:hypothetical protein RFI_04536 [Reticulomyxa filosa]|uniref:RanBP2-type domain-containing protein n=1 Tax=Reticulomyxa filosa TaxID=46433 RepID=X6P2W7_RETFI|nr:hypothetical protein RFI_04536 [Reticulomyxa filosa]|eukprot:ETO32581.1 hypothetical protein RFI_04536 [Reticulomyxa filosa]
MTAPATTEATTTGKTSEQARKEEMPTISFASTAIKKNLFESDAEAMDDIKKALGQNYRHPKRKHRQRKVRSEIPDLGGEIQKRKDNEENEEDEEEPQEAATGPWSCSICTFMNGQYASVCKACNYPRAGGQGQDKGNETDSLMLTTMVNVLEAATCETCGYSKLKYQAFFQSTIQAFLIAQNADVDVNASSNAASEDVPHEPGPEPDIEAYANTDADAGTNTDD